MNLAQIPGPVEAGRGGNVEDQLELGNQVSAGHQFLLHWFPPLPPKSNSPSLRIAVLR